MARKPPTTTTEPTFMASAEVKPEAAGSAASATPAPNDVLALAERIQRAAERRARRLRTLHAGRGIYLALFLCGAIGWLLLVGPEWAPLPDWWAVDRVLPLWTVPLCGLLTGLGATLLVLARTLEPEPAPGARVSDILSDGRLMPQRDVAWLTCLVAVALLILATAAGVLDYLNPVNAALLVVGGVSTVLAVPYAYEAVRREEGIAFETHWGGLGGGLGGWRVSPAAALCLLALILCSSTVAVTLIEVPKPPPREKSTEQQAAEKKAADDKAAEPKASAAEASADKSADSPASKGAKPTATSETPAAPSGTSGTPDGPQLSAAELSAITTKGK